MPTQIEKAALFQRVHQQPEPFVLGNPWDAGSARMLTSLGYVALSTTSAGLAFTLGRRDGEAAITREEAMANARSIVEATHLPVAADLENGYGHAPEIVAETIQLAARAGLVGGSIEDATGDAADPIYPLEHAVQRIAAASLAAAKLPFRFMLVARAENYLHGRPDLLDTIRRLQAFERAGAEVLYAPGLTDPEDIRAVCAAVHRPVNVLMGMKGAPPLSVAALGELGVRRISIGSGFSRAALTGFVSAAREAIEYGTFQFANQAMATSELTALLEQ